MKKFLSFLVSLVAFQIFSAAAVAQTVVLADADKLFDFAEMADPGAFAPPAETQQLNVVDNDWYLRFYSSSGIYLAINIDGTGPFFAGEVYGLGGAFGEVPAPLGTLASLIAYIDSLQADDDDDGVINSEDQCADTPTGEAVNAQGCSASQLDDDADGVSNAQDLCPDTPAGASVNGSGCAESELDDDLDGVSNDLDQCPATQSLMPVNSDGCSAQQLGIDVTLADADKLFDFAEVLDENAFAPPTSTQFEHDQGSDWYVRTYTDSEISIKVNVNGFEPFLAGNVYVVGGPFGESEIFIDTLANLVAYIDSLAAQDDDGDGVVNAEDQCAGTPGGEEVDAQGCSSSQLDDDDDGVSNALDQCPATPTGESVDAQGCSESQSGGGGSEYILEPGSGACWNVIVPAEGTIGEYQAWAETEEGGEAVLEYTEEWLFVSETEVQTRNTQVMELEGIQNETVAETTQYLDISDNLLFLTETFATVTTTVTGFPVPPTVVEVTVVMDPMLFIGPFDTYCEGMVLHVPSVEETATTVPDPFMLGPVVSHTPDVTMTVISVNEAVSVTAGNFTTMHVSSAAEEGTVDVWTDTATGMIVKTEIRDSEGTLIGSTELLSLTN